MPDGRTPSSKWLRYSGLGVELGAAVAAPTLLGIWIDRRWGSEPWGFLAGFSLGMAGGLYHFIRASMIAMRRAGEEDRRQQDDRRQDERRQDEDDGQHDERQA